MSASCQVLFIICDVPVVNLFVQMLHLLLPELISFLAAKVFYLSDLFLLKHLTDNS